MTPHTTECYRDLPETSSSTASLEASWSSMDVSRCFSTVSEINTRRQEWGTRISEACHDIWEADKGNREALEYQGFSYDRVRSQWKRQTFKWITQIIRDGHVSDGVLAALFDVYVKQCNKACQVIVDVCRTDANLRTMAKKDLLQQDASVISRMLSDDGVRRPRAS